jgi:hypothetical protein
MPTFWNRQSVPKHRHIKFRRRGIAQKKACSKGRVGKLMVVFIIDSDVINQFEIE